MPKLVSSGEFREVKREESESIGYNFRETRLSVRHPLLNETFLFLSLLQRGTCFFLKANVVTLQLAIKRGATYSEHFPGEDLIAMYLGKDTFDGGTLNILEIRGRVSEGG